VHVVDLIRHAESTWIKEAEALPIKLFGGRMNDVDLSAKGVRQAGQLGDYALQNGIVPTDFYSSIAKRAIRTHELSSRKMGITVRAITDGRLQELDWGKWTKKPRSIRDEPRFAEERLSKGLDFAPPSGESINTVRRRAVAALQDIVAKTPPGSHIWVHTHRNLIKAVVQPWFGWTAEQTSETGLDVVSLTRLQMTNGKLKLIFFNQLTL